LIGTRMTGVDWINRDKKIMMIIKKKIHRIENCIIHSKMCSTDNSFYFFIILPEFHSYLHPRKQNDENSLLLLLTQFSFHSISPFGTFSKFNRKMLKSFDFFRSDFYPIRIIREA